MERSHGKVVQCQCKRGMSRFYGGQLDSKVLRRDCCCTDCIESSGLKIDRAHVRFEISKCNGINDVVHQTCGGKLHMLFYSKHGPCTVFRLTSLKSWVLDQGSNESKLGYSVRPFDRLIRYGLHMKKQVLI